MSDKSDFSEFTVGAYERLLIDARDRYEFVGFPQGLDGPGGSKRPYVLWRHDVDVSVHRGLELARIEKRLGVVSTYFFLFHSAFYNPLEKEVAGLVAEILSLGHYAGLHFDLDFYSDVGGPAALERRVVEEAQLFASTFGTPAEAVSFHNPEIGNAMAYDQDRLAGLVNTYGKSLREGYEYVSDSNGFWRFKNLFELVATGPSKPLHVLTHPEWWVGEPMSPRDRISRAIDGRARRTHHWYDEALRSMGRKNVR